MFFEKKNFNSDFPDDYNELHLLVVEQTMLKCFL